MSPRQSHSPHAGPEPGAVRVIDNAWVELSDGIRLAIRLWLPVDANERPVSAVLDAVPYRKSDGTAIHDAAWGTYFAAHGFAFARVDLRGSGDSSGLLEDEYTEQEQRDNESVISWLAEQAWCTGSVGMIGVSWGAFAALQMAARAPEQLRGIVPIHGSDDRYADDVHYYGGCVSGMDMSQWATSMLAYLNQPPDPRVVGERWRELWLERLQHATAWIEPWLGHQRRDDYWRQGSACEHYERIRCAVFAVGGWGDGYRDMVFRVLENVKGRVRGLIGPWGHLSPESGRPGPAIGFLQECVRFFAASLDGAENGFFDEPRLIAYLQDPVSPAGSYPERAGRWVADPAWPSPSVEPWELWLGSTGLNHETSAAASGIRRLRGLQSTGLDSGVWDGDGSPADFPLDQRRDDGASLCWDSEPLTERVELLGRGEARLELSVDRPWALVCVRVCDVAADGTSTLVARGLLNLSRREGHDRSVPMPLGETVVVRVPLMSTSYAIPAGHRIRLAVSPTYWPMAWPSPEPVTLNVHAGPRSVLTLPRRRPSELDEQLRPFGAPETGTELAHETTMARGAGWGGGRRVTRNLANGETEIEFDWRPTGSRILDTDTEMRENNITRYRIAEGDPLSASVICAVEVGLLRPGWNTRVEARSRMTSDATHFTVTSALDAYEDDVRVCARTFTHRFPRDGG
ncbi:MAG TPA: CocE/NonD family hydrolase [Solirubrobacteraceae bacterium]|nr:CocE/NonD family hydrolase [Solirubrobacteraceae bacterium]